ncbi:MAG: SDR family NAD(P)-dependent oxidoreductase [Rhodococcus sp. (in: high G+C Gram-positive bacteria)]|nr:MAG: SDR family NAD(P)-dependent oxidoreductase [Rhodococcus sp. (in: high G+C Gram-positive bacteria)]
MTERTWLITGVSSGFGRHLTEQLLERGDRVVGTVRRPESVDELTSRHPDLFRAEVLDVRGTSALRAAVTRIVADFGRIDVAVSNAGYGLFGAAGIGMTLVEPGGARTDFRYRGAQIAEPIPDYDATPAHNFRKMLDPAAGLAPGDPARMAARIIESVDVEPAPLRLMLGSQALESTLAVLRTRVADFEAQTELAASTDFPPEAD